MARSLTRRTRFYLHLLLCLTLGSSACAFANSVRVEAILVNDQDAEQVPAVIIISAQVPQGERRTLRKNDIFASGFEIIAPSSTIITFTSDNGNRIVLQPGARIRVADVTKAGERYLLRAGSVVFEVLRALSFFNVEFDDKFVAQVRGTKFRVTGEEGGGFTCEVLEGAVLVQRSETLRVGTRAQPVIATSPVLLSSEGRSTGRWTESDLAVTRSFTSLKDAQGYLIGKMQQAKSPSLDYPLALGELLTSSGNQSAALTTYSNAQEELSSAPLTPDLKLAELYLRKADVLANMNRAQEALGDYDLARRTYNALYTPDASREIARVLTGEALVYTKLKRYDVAAEKYAEAIAVESKFTLGVETPRIRRNIEAINELHRLAPNKVRPPQPYRFTTPLQDPPALDHR
jgi:hypothetical protein